MASCYRNKTSFSFALINVFDPPIWRGKLSAVAMAGWIERSALVFEISVDRMATRSPHAVFDVRRISRSLFRYF